jgi:uncharacterized membrane protein
MDLALAFAFIIVAMLGLAYWASRGGTARVLVGLGLSVFAGLLVGVPIYAVATLVMRHRRPA